MLSITATTAPILASTKDSQRTERVILVVLILVALIGVGILVWILILRPLGIVYQPTVSSPITANLTFQPSKINLLELMSFLRYKSLLG